MMAPQPGAESVHHCHGQAIFRQLTLGKQPMHSDSYTIERRVGVSATRVRKYRRMASVATSPAPDTAVITSKPLHEAPESLASVQVNAIPPREQVRMGRAATVPSGVTWLTLSVIIFFHAGALAAFFFF